MNRERKTNRVMVKGVRYRKVPAGPCCPNFNCEGCIAQHNRALCLDLPSCCQYPSDCIYVEEHHRRGRPAVSRLSMDFLRECGT